MTRHDCPYCECDGRLWFCGYCRQSYNENEVYDERLSQGFCSQECESAQRLLWRQREWDNAFAERARRLEAGRGVCRAHVRGGRPCMGHPIRGADLCHAHADDGLRDARDYGRYLGEMAVNDVMAVDLAAGRAWPAVIESNRLAVVLDELRQQLTRPAAPGT